MLLNFSAAFSGSELSAPRINATGALFVELLGDMERLLSTDTAFMLGPWLAAARKLGGSAADCNNTRIAGDIGRCDDFMEWNARAQLTTWCVTWAQLAVNCTKVSACLPLTHYNIIHLPCCHIPARYPVLGSAAAPRVQQGGRDHDYARKQWSGPSTPPFLPPRAMVDGDKDDAAHH